MTIISPPTTKSPIRQSRRPAVAGVDLLAIAQGLASSAASWPGMADPVERRWRTIATTDRFEAFLIAWPPGGAIDLHDHGSSAGALAVASGSLVETSVSRGGDTLVVTTVSIPTGGYVVFEPGHVHDIVNDGPESALSIHVYSPVLSTMTFFNALDGRDLVVSRTESYSDGQVLL